MRQELDDTVSRAIIEVIEADREITAEGLIECLSEKLRTRKEHVAKSLYRLLKDGKVELEDPSPARTILQYAKSSYSLWFWCLLALVVLAASTVYTLPQYPPYIYTRYLLGSLFVLYLPGYSLIEALFPIKDGLDSLERVALSIGLSLALVPLVGLLLNYTPWGIRLDPIFLSLSLLTGVLAVAALVRKFSCFKLALKPGPVERAVKRSSLKT